jgi:hypothetical protein
MSRKIDFLDGALSATAPTLGNIEASDLVNFTDDAAYEAANTGAPAAGNIYHRDSDNVIRWYDGTQWNTIATLPIAAADVSYDNATSGLTATDVQAAIDEVEGRVDTNETDISTNTGNISTNTTNIGTNTGNIAANTSDIADIRTTQGTSDGDTNLGTFSGSIISDNTDIKTALQELETALEPITDGLDFQGTWDANTNTPTLTSSSGTKGHFYIVDTAGSTNLDGITDWNNGDWAVFDGSVWRKVDNTDSVTSVNSQTGAVSLDLDDIADVDAGSPNNNDVLTYNNGSGNWEASAVPSAPVSSVNSQTGAVVLDIDDVTPTTTKGDIIVEDGSNAIRLPVGTDGQILSANSAQPGGLQWITSSGGGGGGDLAVRSDSSTFTAGLSDQLLLVSGASFTVNLPTASGNTGKEYWIKKTDSSLSNIITIDGNGAETIGGSTTRLLHTENEMYHIVSDGTNWQVLNHETLTPIVTDTTVTFNTGSLGTTSIEEWNWHREGQYAIVELKINGSSGAGVAGSGDYRLTMPSGLQIDTTVTGTETSPTVLVAMGSAILPLSSVNMGSSANGWNFQGYVQVYSSTLIRAIGYFNSSTVIWAAANFGLSGTTPQMYLSFKVPIQDWTP